MFCSHCTSIRIYYSNCSPRCPIFRCMQVFHWENKFLDTTIRILIFLFSVFHCNFLLCNMSWYESNSYCLIVEIPPFRAALDHRTRKRGYFGAPVSLPLRTLEPLPLLLCVWLGYRSNYNSTMVIYTIRSPTIKLHANVPYSSFLLIFRVYPSMNYLISVTTDKYQSIC